MPPQQSTAGVEALSKPTSAFWSLCPLCCPPCSSSTTAVTAGTLEFTEMQGWLNILTPPPTSSSSCGRRETIQLHLPDVEKSSMASLLKLLYTGSASLHSRSSQAAVKGVMKLLDLALPGGVQCEEEKGPHLPGMDTPESSVKSVQVKRPASSPSLQAAVKRPKPSNGGGEVRHPLPHFLL